MPKSLVQERNIRNVVQEYQFFYNYVHENILIYLFYILRLLLYTLYIGKRREKRVVNYIIFYLLRSTPILNLHLLSI